MRERAEELGGSFEFASTEVGSSVRVSLPLHDLGANGDPAVASDARALS
jgi:signal transduction histidine kinase